MNGSQGNPWGGAPYTPAQPLGGYTPEQVAQMAINQGCTPEQIIQMINAQQIPPYQPMGGFPPEQMQQMPPASGYSPEEMAQAAMSQGYPPEQLAAMLYSQGVAPEQIAMTTPMRGYSPEQIMQMLQTQGFAANYQMPPMPAQQEAPQKKPKKIKQKRYKPPKPPLSTKAKIIRVLLALAVVGAAAWFVVSNFVIKRATTAIVEASEIGNVYTGDALIVRNETAYDEEGVQSIDYVAQEGGIAYRGDIVCHVYSTGYSAKETTILQDYRDQIKDYQRTLLKSETANDLKMTTLDSDVIQRGLEVRSLVQGARGNLTNQETILAAAITKRQNFFRNKYQSDMRLSRLYDDENAQQRRIEGWIKPKVATGEESIVSFYTDGFEYALSPTRYETYSPSQVRSMINGDIPDVGSAARGRTNMYRLVKKNNYAVLMLIKNSVWNPVEGEVYKLVLEQFSNTTVDAMVSSFTRSGGELLVRLAVIGDVTDVLYMRTCQAQLGEYVDCLSVPKTALYEQNEAIGIVVISGDRQSFVPVSVLREENDRAYISAIQTGTLAEGMTVRLFP